MTTRIQATHRIDATRNIKITRVRIARAERSEPDLTWAEAFPRPEHSR